jgi:hypothetical protein
MPLLDMNSGSQNPFASYNVGQDTMSAQQMAQNYQGGIDANQAKYDKTAAEGAAYPTFANSYGIGTQNPFGSAATTGSSSSDASKKDDPSTDANRGFNPWSMVGEANVR